MPTDFRGGRGGEHPDARDAIQRTADRIQGDPSSRKATRSEAVDTARRAAIRRDRDLHS